MPTVIDSLVVQLGLDTSKLTQQQRAALDSLKHTSDESIKFGNVVEAQGARIGDLFSKLKLGFVGLLGGIVGHEAAQFIDKINGVDAANARLSRTTNVSVRELSAWQGAIQQNGGSAESASAAVAGLTSEVQKFKLTGQTSLLPLLSALDVSLYDQAGRLKTATQLYLEFSDAIKGRDPAEAAALLSMIPGMNQDMINLLIQGKTAVQGYLAAAREAGGTTKESAAAALEYQKNLALLERTASSAGRTLVNFFAPATATFMKGLGNLFSKDFWADTWAGLMETNDQAAAYTIGKRMLARKFAAQVPDVAAPSVVPGAGGTGGHAASAAEREAFIRKTATELRIDPDQAMRVARSEGFDRFSGDQGTSFGDFQLHYKNNIPGLSNGGLGDAFTRDTGLDARDPKNWQAADRYALQNAARNGWGAWHGWRGMPFQGIGVGGRAAAGTVNNSTSTGGSSTVSIGAVNVYPPNGDADTIARTIKPALERENFAASANYGQM